MALQRNTVILVAIALLMGGFTYVVTQHPKILSKTQVKQTQAVKLFDFTEAQMTGFSLKVQDQNLVFQQKTTNSVNQWWLVQPEKKKANRGAIAFLLDLLTGDREGEPFPVTQGKLAAYGLTKPYATLTIQLVGGSKRKLTLGNENFDQTKIYGRVDDDLKVWLLPLDFRNGVTREFKEWVESTSTTDVSN